MLQDSFSYFIHCSLLHTPLVLRVHLHFALSRAVTLNCRHSSGTPCKKSSLSHFDPFFLNYILPLYDALMHSKMTAFPFYMIFLFLVSVWISPALAPRQQFSAHLLWKADDCLSPHTQPPLHFSFYLPNLDSQVINFSKKHFSHSLFHIMKEATYFQIK